MMTDTRPVDTSSDWSPERLKAWRLSREWTQEQAASWYGVTQSTWKDWETGRYPIPLHVKKRLAEQEDAA